MIAAFALIVYSVMHVTTTFLVEQRMRENLAIADELALEAAPYVRVNDANSLYTLLKERAAQTNARFLVLNPQGTVLVDSHSSLNGVRLALTEVLDIAQGSSTQAYGLRYTADANDVPVWLGYYTAAVSDQTDMIGIVMMSASVQDVFDRLTQIQQTMLIYFFLVVFAVAVLIFWFSGLITHPLNALNDVMQQTVRQGFSVRATPKGNDEVAQLGRTFNDMSEKLQNLDQMRNDFISNASHELKTPLAAMKILVESMLSMDPIDQEHARDFLHDINGEIDRLNSIVQDLLTLVRFDGKSMPLKKEPLALNELVYDTTTRLVPIARTGQITLEQQVDEICFVEVDPMRFSQVIYNLTDNAIKYTLHGGKVVVTVGHEGQRVFFRVQDTGLGIPKASLAHIFDRFYRVDKARSRATGGTGLGLAIVQNIVKIHDGDIEVESQEGVGSTFTVWLPMIEDPYKDFIDESETEAGEHETE